MLDLTQPLHQQIDEALHNGPVLWVSTVRPDGAPHLVPVWFLWDGKTFLFYSQPGDQKIRNLRRSPLVTLGIAQNGDASSVALFQGEAELSDQITNNVFPQEYVTKYRALIDEYGWDEAEMAQQYSVLVRVRPKRMNAW